MKFYAYVNSLRVIAQTGVVYVEPQHEMDIRIQSVEPKTMDTVAGDTVKCSVTSHKPRKKEAVPGEKVPESIRKNVKWDIKIGGNLERLIVDDEVIRGGEISFKVPEEWTGKEVTVILYLHSSTEDVAEKLNVFSEEIVIIVGTEQHTDNLANKMMFMGVALFTIRTKYAKHKGVKVLVFTDGYSDSILYSKVIKLRDFR